MKLYYHPLSGHAHRVRLFLSLLGVAHELVQVDLMAGAPSTVNARQMRELHLKVN